MRLASIRHNGKDLVAVRVDEDHLVAITTLLESRPWRFVAADLAGMADVIRGGQDISRSSSCEGRNPVD